MDRDLDLLLFASTALVTITFIVTGLRVTRTRVRDALRKSQMYLTEAQRVSRTGSFGWNEAGGDLIWSDQTFRLCEVDPSAKLSFDRLVQLAHPEDAMLVRRFIQHVCHDEGDWEVDYRLLMPSGSIKHIRAVAHTARDARGSLETVGAMMDVTAAHRAEDELRQAQAELARVSRVMLVGEMSAAITHEVSQPISAIAANAAAGANWLARLPPDIDEARRALIRIADDARGARDVAGRIRSPVKKLPARSDSLDLSTVVGEVLSMIESELRRNRVRLQTVLSDGLPIVPADRIQVQQVLLYLIVNGIEATNGINDRPRELVVFTGVDAVGDVFVEVRDSGDGFDPQDLDRLFTSFYTTKADGMGMGLAISRTIVEAHGGRLWATPNHPHGAVFGFSLPSGPNMVHGVMEANF